MMELARGERLGDWVVDKPLGAGGMGSVYRCHSVLAEDVVAAVKVLDRTESADFEKRFVQELRTLSSLNHPAIVRVLGGGRHEQKGMLYLAMELVDGEDLHSRLHRGALGVGEALQVFGPISDALRYAHASGVAHRDIKPANVMIRSNGQPVIVDFGIAVSSGSTRHTQEGMVPGTMAYLPPEAFAGRLPDPKATDAYALGVVLWQSLTGQEPFAPDPTSTAGQQLAQIMGKKLRSDALDPGAHIPEPVRQAVLRTTDPEPDSRLVDMLQVRQLLEEAGGKTYEFDVPPPRPTLVPPVRPKRWGRRLLMAALALTTTAAVLVAILLVAIVAVGGVVWGLSAPSPEPIVVRAPVDLAVSLAAGADALEAGDLGTARIEAGHALDDHPQDPNANLLYGQVLLASNATTQSRPYFCAAVKGGLKSAVPGVATLDCEAGPGAVAPLVAKLAVARLDQSSAIAALDRDAGDAVASADEEPSRSRRPSPVRRDPASAASPAPAAAPAPAPRAVAAQAPMESAADEEAMDDSAPGAASGSGITYERARSAKQAPAKPSPAIRLTINATTGTIDDAFASAVLRRFTARVSECAVSGKTSIRLSLTIGADGVVSDVQVRDLDRAESQCVISLFKGKTLGSDGKAGTITATWAR